jgi:(S)-sulfolactate dehydrogenase
MVDIVVSEIIDEAALAPLAKYDVLYDQDLVDRPDDLAKELSTARALIVRNRTQVTPELIAAAPKLEVVGRLGVGLDNINLDACAAAGVKVCPASGANALAVAEYAIGAMFTLFRECLSNTPAILDGTWPRMKTREWEVAGKTMGIIGYGDIGTRTGGLARALGMKVVACDPLLGDDHPAWKDVARRELDALLAEADVVSLHVPLDDSTRNMIGADQLARMKPTAILINSARGGIIDETALVAALKAGSLAGASIDVFPAEPLDREKAAKFRDTPNLILTPHMAGLTDEALDRVHSMVVRRVLEVLEG